MTPLASDASANDSTSPEATSGEPTCYFERGRDAHDALGTVVATVEEWLREETPITRFVRLPRGAQGPPPLRDEDLYVFASVDSGGGAKGQWFSGPALFSVETRVALTGRVKKKGSAKGLQFAVEASETGPGLIGLAMQGQMMKGNVNAASLKFARRVAVFASGRRLLNQDIRSYAKYSIVLGVLGLLPLFGFVTWLPGVILGWIALAVLRQRPLGRWTLAAQVGLGVNALSPLVAWIWWRTLYA